jgi:hypothetical protein
VGAGAEMDIAVGQGGELGRPQPGLDREQDPGVITAPGPGGPVGNGEQGLGLVLARKVTIVWSLRLGGIASTRAMAGACSG